MNSSSSGGFDATVGGDDATVSDDGGPVSDDATSDAPSAEDTGSSGDSGATGVVDAGEDSGSSTVDAGKPVDAGEDASTPVDAGKPVDAGGEDSGVHADAGADASAVNTSPAGTAAITAYCNAECAALTTDCRDAGACTGCPGSPTAAHPIALNERADYVSDVTACLPGAIAVGCANPSGAIEYCALAGLTEITPSAAATAFCNKVASSLCAGVLGPNVAYCLSNAGIYSDSTIAAYSACLSELPDAAVDGGCNNLGACLQNASEP